MINTTVANKNAKWHVLIGSYFSNMGDFFDLMILSFTLPYIMKEFGISLGQAGMIGTLTLIGCGISSFVWGWVADNKGRKPALLGIVISFSILTGSLAFTTNYSQFLILRFLCGIALGGVFFVIGTLLTEAWPAHLRGRVISLTMTSSVVAIFLTGFISARIIPAYGWRSMFLLGFCGILVALYVYFFVPESEVWKKRGSEQQTSKVNVSLVDGLKELFSGKNTKVTILGSLVAFGAQLTYWGFMFWLPSFLIKERMLAPGQVGSYTSLMSLGLLVALPIAGMISDKIGRKMTLMISFIIGGILIPIYVSIQDLTVLYWLGPFVLAVFIYPGLFNTYFPELFPTHIRGFGSGFLMNTGRGFSAIGPFGVALIAGRYSLATSIAICGLVYFCSGLLMIFLPETYGKTKGPEISKTA